MGRMSRRRFLQRNLGLAGLGLLVGCGVLPSHLQPPAKVPRVGFLGLGTSGPNPRVEAFR